VRGVVWILSGILLGKKENSSITSTSILSSFATRGAGRGEERRQRRGVGSWAPLGGTHIVSELETTLAQPTEFSRLKKRKERTKTESMKSLGKEREGGGQQRSVQSNRRYLHCSQMLNKRSNLRARRG